MNGQIDKDSIKLDTCKNPKFIKVQEISYIQDGKQKTWEIAKTHNSVSALIIDKKLNKFTFVKQFRPPVFLQNEDGFMYELCSGITDKDMSLEKIVQEEIMEECGYDVPLENLLEIKSFFSAVGFAGARQTLFFAFVDEAMKKTKGGGIGDENIEVIEYDIDKAYDFLFSKSTTPAVLYSILEYFKRYALK